MTPEGARAEARDELSGLPELWTTTCRLSDEAFNAIVALMIRRESRAAQGAPPVMMARAMFAYRARAYQYSPETPTDLDNKYASALEAGLAASEPPSSSRASGGEAHCANPDAVRAYIAAGGKWPPADDDTRLRAAGEQMAAALQRLRTTMVCDADGNVTPEWNAAYIEAGERLAAWRQAVNPKENT